MWQKASAPALAKEEVVVFLGWYLRNRRPGFMRAA
jgi:hypothetical protein